MLILTPPFQYFGIEDIIATLSLDINSNVYISIEKPVIYLMTGFFSLDYTE